MRIILSLKPYLLIPISDPVISFGELVYPQRIYKRVLPFFYKYIGAYDYKYSDTAEDILNWIENANRN